MDGYARKAKGWLLGTASRFGRTDEGAIAVWFSLLLVPMLGFTYGAIKFSQLAEQRSGMIDAMDAAALALARQYEFRDLEPCSVADGETDEAKEQQEELFRYAREFFSRNYPEHRALYADEGLTRPLDVKKDLVFKLSCSTVRVQTKAYSDMGGVLAEEFGVGAIPLDLGAEISLPGNGRVEIALVLDVTGSMGNKASGDSVSKMDKLKDAIDVMLNNPKFYGKAEDTENDFVRISVVPFNSVVNPGAAYEGTSEDMSVYDKTSDWIDGWNGATPEAYWHGANFFHTELPGGLVTGWNGFASYTSSRPVVTDQKVNHNDLFGSVGDDGMTWKGCVEARPFPLDEYPTTAGEDVSEGVYARIFQRPSVVTAGGAEINGAWNKMADRPTVYDGRDSEHSKFVPFFYPDEPDCQDNACNFQTHKKSSYRAFVVSASTSNQNESFPGYIFDDAQGGYDNAGFVRDKYYTRRAGTASHSDVYRNLVLDAREQLNAISPGCNGPYPYAVSAPLRAAIAKLGYLDCGDHEARFRHGYVGYWQDASGTTPARYVGKYQYAGSSVTGDPHSEIDSTRSAGKGPNRGCAGPIQPLSSKKKEIRDAVQALLPGGYTNTAIGMIWGWRTLTHEAPFVEGADPDSQLGKRWRKHVVLMTDGDNTFDNGGGYKGSAYSPYGYSIEDRLGVMSGTSDFGVAYSREFDRKTIRICHRMRAEGIKVYTVGFNIKKNSRADKMLAACAIDKDAYFYAANGTDLATAFESITSQIVDLHISG